MVNVKVVNANALLAGKVIVASAHHNQQSTAWIQRARFAVEEENVYVENVSAQIQEALAVSVNIALLVTKPVKKTGMFLLLDLTFSLPSVETWKNISAWLDAIFLSYLDCRKLVKIILDTSLCSWIHTGN